MRSCSREVGGSSGAAPALALPGPGCHVQAVLGKGNIVPASGLVGGVGWSRKLSSRPQPIRGRVDECTLAGACHAPPLAACGLDVPVPVFGPLPGQSGSLTLSE